MTNRTYEILDRWQVALFIDNNGVLCMLPVGAEGVLENDRYLSVVNFDNTQYAKGEEKEGFADDARAAQVRLRKRWLRDRQS